MKMSMTSPLRAIVCAAGALAAWALSARVAPAAVAVYGEASSSGPTITVNVFADITNTTLISFGVQFSYDPLVLHLQGASKNTACWYLSDGTNQIPYRDPDVSTPGSVLILGGKLDGSNPLQGVTGQRVLLGSVSFSRLAHLPVLFGLSLGFPAPFANFATVTADVLDGATNGVVLNGVTIDPNDTDLDGLPDAWEISHFGSISRYSWNGDPDHDGFNNLQEYLADTDPLDSNSYPHMKGASPVAAGLQIQWQGGIQATQYLQRCFVLSGTNTLWVDIFTNVPPTAIMGSYTDLFDAHTSKFYRIRVTR